ncbi:nuclease-related domain-containing protein [Nocardia salmonicida]|uniref:nuclease-related domain-containing protein n=1 Tax=Nocardia salmonicida TaxID=53431 RepID=UPI000A01EB29|nr:nuclease-related domain-containing protein [Nocardia salmonicida]
MVIVVVADESELEGAEQIVGAALRDQAFRAGGVAVFRCHVPESRGGSVEVDALVCTPQSVTIVEVKGFTARQEGTLATPPNGPWTIDGEPAALYHAVRVPNPFVQVRRQVFAAKSLLQQAGIFGWVNAVIALVSQPGTEITIEETRIADGYRAVLIDRDDVGALHDHFQAESGRTVRLSVDDVTRVFAALNLGHLLPSPDELMAQGFPAVLDPATTSRPAGPTAVELGSSSGTADSDTTSNPAAASASSARVTQAATPAFLAAIDRLAHRAPTSSRPEESATPLQSEEVAESPSSSEESVAHLDDSDSGAVSATAIGRPPSGPEATDQVTNEASPSEKDPSPDDAPERESAETDTASHSESVAPTASFDDDTTDTDSPAPDEVAETSDRASENVVSLTKSTAGTESSAIDDPLAGDGERAASESSAYRHEPTSDDREDAATSTPGPTVGAGAAVGTAAALGAAAAVGSAGSTSRTGSWSTPSPSRDTHAVAPAYRSPEPEAPRENSEHWSDWVEHDRATRRPTLSDRWRSWRRGNGSSLIDRWHNRPVRERSRPRRGLRVGPGVALLLFIALFGAGFFAITAVQASRFEMSDYDRMCGQDKKPFPNAAPYQRDGARPIYLSGELTAMVHPDDPTAWNPDDPSTVQLIACMKQLELRDLVQTCQYDPSPGAPIGRTVNLFRATYEIAVYELHTGREVAKATMLGERYSANPSNTDPDRCRAAADAPDYLGRRLGQPSAAQLTGFLAPLVHADR